MHTHAPEVPPIDSHRRRLLLQGAGVTALTQAPMGAIGAMSTLGADHPATALSAGAPNVSAPQAATSGANLPLGKYRYQQPRLFQSLPAATIPSRLAYGTNYPREGRGPTAHYVDRATGWVWKNIGGDWLDAGGIPQGTRPWFSVPTNAVSGSSAVHVYSVDTTSALQYVQAHGRWCAFLMRSRGAARVMAGLLQANYPVPVITVRHQDGTSTVLRCQVMAVLSAASESPNTTAAQYTLPLLIEFERPAKPVASAQLSFTITQHWSGTVTEVDAFLLDPPLNADAVLPGVAATAGAQDAQLDAHPAVIGVHRYLDGLPWSRFASLDRDPLFYNLGAERNYDPAIFGTGPRDTSKLPHVDLGKWFATGANWSKVDSSHTGDGFAPLLPGLGAVRVTMAAQAGLADGVPVLSGGTLGANARIFLPEPDFGRLKRIFVRYYLRHAPYDAPVAKRYQVLQGTRSSWLDMAGKTGIAPSHVTSYGGVSGSSGGGHGWQMRLSWNDCDAGQGGPDEQGVALGLHTWDFQYNNPVRYSSDAPVNAQFGQRGGLGGVLYHGRWYCIEMEVDLNNVVAGAPGYIPDGAVRLWVDGRLAFEREAMVMRSLPILQANYSPTALRPCRELGHRDLWFNWFHGGTTPNSIDRTLFFTGLVWSRAYIGPMRSA